MACPATITKTATSSAGAVVTYATPTATDNCSGATVSCVPASGTTFAIGATTVTCTARDAANNTSTCAFTVTVDVRDPQRPLLIAEAGATNQQMNAVLAQHGLTLPFNVVLESVRIGGLVATGSHGSGWEMPTLSDLVEAIEIVNAAGELICYRAETHGPQVMNAVRVSLGMFGLIYRVHLRV